MQLDRILWQKLPKSAQMAFGLPDAMKVHCSEGPAGPSGRNSTASYCGSSRICQRYEIYQAMVISSSFPPQGRTQRSQTGMVVAVAFLCFVLFGCFLLATHLQLSDLEIGTHAAYCCIIIIIINYYYHILNMAQCTKISMHST